MSEWYTCPQCGADRENLTACSNEQCPESDHNNMKSTEAPTITHEDLVRVLCKPGADILLRMSPEKMHLLHMVSKLCSEAGELMDAVGKYCYYNKELDIKNVVEELGDMEFYMQGTRAALKITRKETLDHNIDKICTRYTGAVYSDKAAQERKDKQLEGGGK